jgi:hypothetical protein
MDGRGGAYHGRSLTARVQRRGVKWCNGRHPLPLCLAWSKAALGVLSAVIRPDRYRCCSQLRSRFTGLKTCHSPSHHSGARVCGAGAAESPFSVVPTVPFSLGIISL